MTMLLLSSASFAQLTLPVKTDSLKKITPRKLASGIIQSGYISAGEGYGSIPYIYQGEPSFYFKSEGMLRFQAGILPFNVSYSYTDLNNNTGITNYFRIGFDAPRFKKIKQEEIGKIKDTIETKLTKSYATRQELLKRKLANEYKIKPSTEKFRRWKIPAIGKQISDTLAMPGHPKLPSDSIDIPKVKKPNLNVDSLKRVQKQLNDSIKTINADIKKLEKLKSKAKQLSSVDRFISAPHTRLSLSNVLAGFRQLEIGNCNPNYSTFLISNTALHGVNAEWQFDNIYVAGTIGKTTSNFSFNRNNISGKVDEMKNTFNFLDFNDYESGKNIVAIKLGYGKKEETHLYVGRLWGKGYNTTNHFSGNSPAESALEKNTVTEIDGRLLINKQASLDVIVAKSSLVNSQGITNDFVSDSTLSYKTFNNTNSAAQSRLTYNISKARLKLTGNLRWIGPVFKSFGVGFMNSDQLRYEIKGDKSVGKHLQLSLFYRKEQDNIFHLLSSTTVISSYGLGSSIKIGRNLQVRTDLQPMLIKTVDRESGTLVESRNLISTVGLTYLIRSKTCPMTANTYYTYNNVTINSQRSQNKMLSTVLSLNHNSGFNAGFIFSYANLETNDSLSGKKIITTELTCDYKFSKKLIATVKGKYGSTDQHKDVGGAVKLGYSISSRLDLIVSAEKYLVTENIYSTVNDYKKYPYNTIVQLKFHW